MTNNNYEILCTIASNLATAGELVNNVKYEEGSKEELKDSIEMAIVLIECSLEVLKDNKEKLFKKEDKI